MALAISFGCRRLRSHKRAGVVAAKAGTHSLCARCLLGMCQKAAWIGASGRNFCCGVWVPACQPV